MIRPTTPDDVPRLLELTAATGAFKADEVEALGEVFDDFFAGIAEEGDHCATLEGSAGLEGFVYFGPDGIADGTWELWWIVVRKDTHGRGYGKKLLRYT